MQKPDRQSATSGAREGGQRRWRAFAIGCLLATPFAMGVGMLEITLSDVRFPPSVSMLLYGANLHILIAFAFILIARVISWKLPDHSFPPLALAVAVMAELLIVVPYWIAFAPWTPPATTAIGKVIVAGTMAVGGMIGLLLCWLVVRAWSDVRWARAAQRAPGLIGIVLVAALVVANGIAIASAYPRHPRGAARPAPAAEQRAGVVIILVDTLRYDHLSWFAYARPTSPHIDRLFDESIVFTHAYAPSNKTIPSVASIFTGLYPSSHRITGPFERLPEHAPTLAEHFQRYGYRTGAFVANMIVSVKNGFAQGFETFFPRSAPWWSHRCRTALERIAVRLVVPIDASGGRRINHELRQWLADDDTRPHFLYVHYLEPHSPYDPPRPDLEAVAPNAPEGPLEPPLFHQYSDDEACIDWECLDEPPTLSGDELEGMVAAYDGEIHRVDRLIGQVLDELLGEELLDRTHLLFLTDHGEEFGDHNGWFHGHSIYDEVCRSPIAYRPPGGLAGGAVVDEPVPMLDILRALFTQLGMEAPPWHQGRDRPDLLTPARWTAHGDGRPAPGRVEAPVLCELPPHLFSLRKGPWKLIRRGDPQDPDWRLYHLGADPAEQVDLAHAERDTLGILRAYLEASLQTLRGAALQTETSSLDAATLEQLRSLGYLR